MMKISVIQRPFLMVQSLYFLLMLMGVSHAYTNSWSLSRNRASLRPLSLISGSSSGAAGTPHSCTSRVRKRDVVLRYLGSPLRRSSSSRNSELQSKSNDDDDEEEDTTINLPSFVTEKLPPRMVTTFQTLLDKLTSAKTIVASFLTGVILTIALVFVPLYNQVENLSEPITLFETILTDIDKGYVDPVDTDQMFQVGMSAMLRSLDPYTEFESKKEAQELNESIDGKYGGVGLVISGVTPRDLALLNKQQEAVKKSQVGGGGSKLLPQDAIQDNLELKDGDNISNNPDGGSMSDDQEDDENFLDEQKILEKVANQGIRVISAFEGYAFDYGLRVGDKLVGIGTKSIGPSDSVEDVRNNLRGDPGTEVDVSFEREGVDGVQTVTLKRSIVKIRDVKLATLIGKDTDGIGYVQLTGFTQDAGREMRNAILRLQRQAEDATDGERSLQGLIVDMRGNPGGLLTSAVDVASLLVPKDSDIVSARGRGFPGILYRSRVDPIVDPNTKVAVLINGGTASAAEIVTGAVQDLDVGIVVGADKSFGKGLVQNVEELPFGTALKFTVAKYYTPSGRCIQGVNYVEGKGSSAESGMYTANKVAQSDRNTFYTKRGREVKDGGGIEADYKVAAPKASALEITLLRSGVIGDFAAKWSRENELTNSFEVDEETYKQFQNFVSQKQKSGDIKLEALYSNPLNDLKASLKKSGYKVSTKELENLQASIVREVQRDFEKYRDDIKEDVTQGILARYLPESMLIERSIKTDQQVQAAVKLVRNNRQFDKLLARGSAVEQQASSSSLNAAALVERNDNARLKIKW